MDKRFLGILAAIIVIFAGVFAFSQSSSNKSNNKGGGQPSNHITGQGAKNVTLLEYGDYQCPVCESYESVIGQVRANYGNDIRFQFKNLPLAAIHKNAFAAARAAEAASLQNKFWEMHDILYQPDNWQSWTNSSNPRDLFNAYAKQLGLNENQFQSDYASEKVNSVIQADLNDFKKTGKQQATPTFFLDGVYIDNPKLTDQNNRPQFEKFQALIDAEIIKKSPPKQ